MTIIDTTSSEIRDVYDDYLSTQVEKGRQALGFEAWVAYHWNASVAVGPVDPNDDFSF